MKTTRFVVAGALCAWILLTARVLAAGEYSGNWTLMPSETAGKVNFGLVHRRGKNHSHHSSDWPVALFQGVDLAQRGKRDVQFSITRDAGRFDCEGYLNNGVGAGVFLFTPDPGFAQSLRALGFDGVDEEKQFTMATVDVTVEFAKAMKAEKLTGLTTDKLIALRIFDVTAQYIHDLRAEGLPMTDTDKVVAFRVHEVTVESVRAYRKLGIRADEDQLIAMHVHGATPKWIAEMRANGYQDLDVNQLIAFRVHEVTPEFVARMEKLGYGRPDPDQLVAMRVHGVTPEYIDKMKARGVKDLSIDKLIQLRVHGID
ncbi:MAG TPA: hypothetical protein VF033_01870 [Steroidobacteraceae bacterium]